MNRAHSRFMAPSDWNVGATSRRLMYRSAQAMKIRITSGTSGRR